MAFFCLLFQCEVYIWISLDALLTWFPCISYPWLMILNWEVIPVLMLVTYLKNGFCGFQILQYLVLYLEMQFS